MNSQYQDKIDELATSNDDLKNLLASLNMAVLYLDDQLRIKRYTPAATALFNLIEGDIGRPVDHVTSALAIDSILEKAKMVLDTLMPLVVDVEAKGGKWYTMRINPYRTGDSAIAGLVVSFLDIQEVRALQAALSYSQAIVDTVRHPLLVLDAGLKVVSANRAFCQTFKVAPADTQGKLIYELGNREWDIPEFRTLLEEVLPRDKVLEGFRVDHTFPVIGRRQMLLNARRLDDRDGTPQRILLAMEDVTPRTKQREQRTR